MIGMKKKQKYNKSFEVVLFISIALIFVVAGVFCWFNLINLRGEPFLDHSGFGTFGDFVGGTFGFLVACLAGYFAYKAYRIQLKQQVGEHLMLLIEGHRHNVQWLYDTQGKDVFKAYLKVINVYYNEIIALNSLLNDIDSNTKKEVLGAAYWLLFYGTKCSDTTHGNEFINNNIKTQIEAKGLSYPPIYGWLGIYYRQIYQIVKHIDSHKELDKSEKEDYVKLLRVQLNVDEQYLLFINSLIKEGTPWRNKERGGSNYITAYSMIRNIPRSYNFIGGLDVKEIYSSLDYESDDSD